MKTKKALKRLNKIETLLTGVIDRFPSYDGLGTLLRSAKVAVVRARRSINANTPATNKSTANTPASRRTTNGRKRTSLTAKKAVAVATRKRMSTATSRKLSKTA